MSETGILSAVCHAHSVSRINTTFSLVAGGEPTEGDTTMRKILALATVVVAAALFSGAAGATTIHQVQHLADGSAVTFTLATGSAYPAPGAGADVGDFGPADGASQSECCRRSRP
jgi:hypothetical protein